MGDNRAVVKQPNAIKIFGLLFFTNFFAVVAGVVYFYVFNRIFYERLFFFSTARNRFAMAEVIVYSAIVKLHIAIVELYIAVVGLNIDVVELYIGDIKLRNAVVELHIANVGLNIASVELDFANLELNLIVSGAAFFNSNN